MAAKTNFEIIKEFAVEKKTIFVNRSCHLSGGCGAIHGTTKNHFVETPAELREFLATDPRISPTEFVMSLKWAIENRYTQVLRELYLYRPVFSYPKKIRETLLHFAIRTNIPIWVIRNMNSEIEEPHWRFQYAPRTLEIIEIVAPHEPNINRQDGKGRTPFYMACRMNNLPVVEFLHQLGADVNIPDNNGASALNNAIRNSKIDLIRTLVAYGVIPTEKDVFDAFWHQNKREVFDIVFNHEMYSSVISKIRNRVDIWKSADYFETYPSVDPEFMKKRFVEWIN